MNIWLITVGEPLPGFSKGDRLWRSGYLAQLLASRGHNVTWWTSSFDHFHRVHFTTESRSVDAGPGLSLQFLHGRAYRKNVSVARQVNHWQIGSEFRRLAREYPPPAVIICSFPTIELAAEAIEYGRARGVPTFLDIRDLWPDEIVDRFPRAVRHLGQILLAPLFANVRRAMTGATGLVAISGQFLAWGLALAGRGHSEQRDHVFPLGYTGDLEPVTTDRLSGDAAQALGVNANKKIFWFCGTFVGNIDLDTVIEAARHLRARDDIQFVFTGVGERDQEWRRQAHGLANVVFTGWARKAELAYFSSIVWAGLGPYRIGARMTLPNKLFEYMSRGLPVLMSLEGETRELVLGNDIGLWYRAGDSASLGDAIVNIADDRDARERMSANAVRLFRERFSPAAIYNGYADFVIARARNTRD